MSTLSSEQLKENISSIPSELQKALEKQAKARIDVARLETQISRLEVEIERGDNQEDDDDDNDNIPEYNDLENNLELIKLDAAVERLKLKVTEAEDKAEMEFRKSTDKTTEGQVKAAVGTNPTVIELRSKLLDAKDIAKERKITLQTERMKIRQARLEATYSSKSILPPENDKLFDLQEKLAVAEGALIVADNEVEVVRAKVEIYKMLVQLESRI